MRRVVVRVTTKAGKATKIPVFYEEGRQILAALRADRFPMLPQFVWEAKAVASEAAPKRIEDLPRDFETPQSAKWPAKDGKNFRRRIAMEFYRLCELKLRDGTLRIEDADAAAAESSQFDVDKLVLIAWRKFGLERALKDARRLIEEQCGYVRSAYEPTLTVLYRAIDSLDKALTNELPLSLGVELKLVRDAITARSRPGPKSEQIDEDGITRARIDDLVAKIRAMAELSLGSHQTSL